MYKSLRDQIRNLKLNPYQSLPISPFLDLPIIQKVNIDELIEDNWWST